jgi:hypothetical protein
MVQSVMAGIPTVSVQPGVVGPDQCFLSNYNYIPRLTNLAGLCSYLDTLGPGNDSGSSDTADNFARAFTGSCRRLEKLLGSYL